MENKSLNVSMVERVQRRLAKRAKEESDKYDEEFLAKVGIFRKENGRYDPNELAEFAKKYERKYSAVTTEKTDNSITVRHGYEWKLRPQYR